MNDCTVVRSAYSVHLIIVRTFVLSHDSLSLMLFASSPHPPVHQCASNWRRGCSCTRRRRRRF